MAFWSHHGYQVNPCVHLRIDPTLRPPVLGETYLGGCEVELASRLFPARSRWARRRLCLTVLHEVGHTLGLAHRPRGIMAPSLALVGYTPAECRPGNGG